MMRANCSRMPGSDTSFAPMSVEVTEDAALGGRLRLKQPKRGHRVGHDAILLAAASAARAGERAVDLGAGVGAAGLALALRVEGTEVVLVEVDAELARLGAATVLPVHPGEEEAAIRVLVRATKASRAPLALLPGFVLNDRSGRPTAQAESVLRDGAALPLSEI